MPQNHPKRVTGGAAPQLNFPVTDEQIATAVPTDSAHCMIADGLKAALPHARGVTVDLATIRYTDVRNGRRYIHLTPPEAQYALLQFDWGIKPKSFVVKNHAVQIIEPSPRRSKSALPETIEAQGDGQQTPESPSISGTVDQFGETLSPSFPETLSPSLPETMKEVAEQQTALSPSFPETPEAQPATGSVPETQEEQTKRQAPRLPYLIPNPAGGGTIPIKINGTPPPLGPLATGKGSQQSDLARRTGRIRKFGLRSMGRIKLDDDDVANKEDVVD